MARTHTTPVADYASGAEAAVDRLLKHLVAEGVSPRLIQRATDEPEPAAPAPQSVIAFAGDADIALHPALDRSRPNAARVHNSLLRERDNSTADRRVAATLEKRLPGVADAVWAARSFAVEAVRSVARRGFGLFVDLGCGYPVEETVHEAAQGGSPGVSVLYLDHDPVVVAHARALLAGGDAVEVVRADVRDELGRVLGHPSVRAWVDLGEPVVVVMTALAEHLTDGELAAVLDTLAGTLRRAAC
jgi:SAM-dependent methyltransferase